ncbi:hypothetical protein ACOMHN_050039 [Nucella lapillus]
MAGLPTPTPTWEDRKERCLSLRSGQGRPVKVVREMYLRPDIPCFSPLCLAGCANHTAEAMLPKEASHYIVPDCAVAKEYLELFELPDVQGVVFTQTAAHYVQHEGSRRLAGRLKRLVQTPGAGCVLLCNEFQKFAHCLQDPTETVAEWQTRRQYDVSSLDDLARTVELSTPTSRVNIPQLVGREDGTVMVPTYNWQEYLTPAYKQLKNIKPVGHFRFTATNPGVVFYKTTIADEEQQFQHSVPDPYAALAPMPALIPPPLLSHARRQYLFNSIRQSTFRAAEWLFDHLAGQVPVIMVTKDQQVAERYRNEKLGVLAVSFQQYIREFWTGQDAVVNLHTSLAEVAAASKEECRQCSGYLPQAVLEEGLKTARFVSGRLNVNRFNASSEAFVARSGVDLSEESGCDILVVGSKDRNRAVHGDEVVVDLFPKSQWRVRSLAVNIAEENDMGEGAEKEKKEKEKEEEEEKEEERSGERRRPTGRVVGVLRRQWRDYVASLSPDEVCHKHSNKSGKILVIPWDYRIPKIRIATSQVDLLKQQRCLVRIDNWPGDSQYPNGHLVRMLGPIGDLETEIAALLAENELSTSAFTPAQLAELPSDTADSPWEMTREEVERRRDLRQSHLVFSIDPKGCEDVDDTLSLRKLDNGNLELGVHIADVTHFVRPGSLTDREAQSRSTTIYLADRRYDMLPAVLSANLCSLVSGKDRYAVSVMWELTPQFDVVSVWYGRTVIHSQYKLFYEMAQKICDGCSDEDIVESVPELHCFHGDELSDRLTQLRWSLRTLTEAGRSLNERRTRCGALQLESVEVQVQLTQTKGVQDLTPKEYVNARYYRVQDLTPKEHLEVHETIAECMIFTNHWVAKRIAAAFPSRALLRNHPSPRQDQFDNLLRCASTRGFSVDTTSNMTLAASLDLCTDPSDPWVNSLLRSLATLAMSNAHYFCTGAAHGGQFTHYGLALDHYTHFTSPIRRYADVVVHRLLLAAVEKDSAEKEVTGEDPSESPEAPVVPAPSDVPAVPAVPAVHAVPAVPGLPGSRELEEMTEHMNSKHRAAQNAQRDSQELFQSMFFRDREDGDDVCTSDAIVYQLRTNGVFVFVPRYGVKGMAYLQDRGGQVVYLSPSEGPQWLSGSLAHSPEGVTVQSSLGSQTYCLLEHVTVRLSVNTSRAHCQSLKMEVVAKQPHTPGGGDNAEVTTKADIVKRVKHVAGEEEGRGMEGGAQAVLDSLDPDLAAYRQTRPHRSLYRLFQSFHRAGLHV